MPRHSTYDILIFGAHPDDAEMSMGGTIIRLSDAGYKVLVVPLTHSEMSTFGDPVTREKEAQDAAKIMGVETEFLDFLDLHIENTPAAREKVVRVLRTYQPKIVFAPYHTNPLAEHGGVAHVDHYTTGSLVRDSVKLSRLQRFVPDIPKHTIHRTFFYMLPRNVLPAIVVDVSPVIDRAFEAIRAYKSQMEINFRGSPIEYNLQTSRAAVGLSIGAKFAEGFVTDTPLAFDPQQFFAV